MLMIWKDKANPRLSQMNRKDVRHGRTVKKKKTTEISADLER